MSKPSSQQSLLSILSVFLFVAVSTILVSIFARGYQISLKPGTIPVIKATGLLSATSKPKGASVYLNDNLVTATDDTLNLSPGNYTVKIIKDGYLPWQKVIRIQKELVYTTDAQLFRSAPDLKPITSSGAINPTVSPDSLKIIFAVASASASKDNGLYLIELASTPLSLGRNTPRQIASNTRTLDWAKATFTFSPDSRQVLATFTKPPFSYLLNLASPITTSNLYDITPTLPLIRQEWQLQLENLISSRLEKIPENIKSLVATDSAHLPSYSSTEDKFVYLINSGPDKDQYAVFDLNKKEIYLLGSQKSISNPVWIPSSNNLLYITDNTIEAIEYDGTNRLTLYAGNLDTRIVYPASDGNRFITLTAPFKGAQENLYSITIR